MFINGLFLKRTSPEVTCLHLMSSRREMRTPSVSNVIYHKFSHGAAFCTLNGKNVNVMLESVDNVVSLKSYDRTCNNTLARTCNVIDNVNNAFSYYSNTVNFEGYKTPFSGLNDSKARFINFI